MATTETPPANEVRYLSPEETIEYFDAQAQRILGISGDEFLRRWDAGEYKDADDPVNYPGLAFLVLLSQSVR